MEVHLLPSPRSLEAEAVRWYSYRAPWDPAEASKLPEVPHRGSLLRFCAADSAALEQEFRCGAAAARLPPHASAPPACPCAAL